MKEKEGGNAEPYGWSCNFRDLYRSLGNCQNIGCSLKGMEIVNNTITQNKINEKKCCFFFTILDI